MALVAMHFLREGAVARQVRGASDAEAGEVRGGGFALKRSQKGWISSEDRSA